MEAATGQGSRERRQSKILKGKSIEMLRIPNLGDHKVKKEKVRGKK